MSNKTKKQKQEIKQESRAEKEKGVNATTFVTTTPKNEPPPPPPFNKMLN